MKSQRPEGDFQTEEQMQEIGKKEMVHIYSIQCLVSGGFEWEFSVLVELVPFVSSIRKWPFS
jgi:hypothetical protein